MKRLFITLIVTLLLCASCEDSYSVYSTKYPVCFTCSTLYAPFNEISSMGVFVGVRKKTSINGYVVTTVSGKITEFSMSQVEARNFEYGLGGLLIGTPYFGEGEVYVYDWACPNCDKASYRLSFNEQGKATCGHCGNEYDLNNGGVVTSGSGRPLLRYRVSLTGSQLYAHN